MATTISNAIHQFIQEINDLPTTQSMDDALEKAINIEREIRFLFGSDPHNRLLRNLYLGLIDVFGLDPAVRRTRARMIVAKPDLNRRHIFPVKAAYRRPNLVPSTVQNIEVFRRHWEIFTHGILSKMKPADWENVIAAGGSVLACLAPPRPAIPSKDLNKAYQSGPYASSDIDFFLWGLSPEEAKVKMEDIYKAVCAAVHWDVVCVRKAHVVSIHTIYPSRPIQIVLRLYQSPAEILAGFDVDAACCAYDGKQVWVNPRSLTAIIRQSNTIDLSRRSPSYEIRLAKYAERNYEIYLPSLSRGELNPLVYARSLQTLPNGLGRLLVLERAYFNPSWFNTLKYPRTRTVEQKHYPRYTIELQETPGQEIRQVVSNNYDDHFCLSKIPYGPKWNAPKIRQLISRKDASMNSPFNVLRPRHRHIFFAGTMQQCIGSFCTKCESESGGDSCTAPYIRGPISFMTTNPGRQLMTGSFNPIDFGEWAEGVYKETSANQ